MKVGSSPDNLFFGFKSKLLHKIEEEHWAIWENGAWENLENILSSSVPSEQN